MKYYTRRLKHFSSNCQFSCTQIRDTSRHRRASSYFNECLFVNLFSSVYSLICGTWKRNSKSTFVNPHSWLTVLLMLSKSRRSASHLNTLFSIQSDINTNSVSHKRPVLAVLEIMCTFHRRDRDLFVFIYISKKPFKEIVLFVARYFPRTYVMSNPQAQTTSWKRKEKRVWESLCESESEKWWLLVLVTASSKKVSTYMWTYRCTHREYETHRTVMRVHTCCTHIIIYKYRGAYLLVYEYLWRQITKHVESQIK